jgi:TetR/AcrR family transcriptional regulator, fatty acid biosynthesis regulator
MVQAAGAKLEKPPLTRKEAKRRTRQKLLEAAREIILTRGEAAVTALAVSRAAGVGGATFYEHFRNKDDLLRALAEELFAAIRHELQEPRREALRAPGNEAILRQQFRRPLELLVANPEIFRLALRVRHATDSPLGDQSRQLRRNTRTDVVEELTARGYPHATDVERRRLEMVADLQIAAVEALALGHLAGRYPDLEEIVDILVLVTHGTRLVRGLGPGGRRA